MDEQVWQGVKKLEGNLKRQNCKEIVFNLLKVSLRAFFSCL